MWRKIAGLREIIRIGLGSLEDAAEMMIRGEEGR